MPNLAVRYCGKCGEVGGDKTGFSPHCVNDERHEPEIIEVSPPLDPTDVYVVGAGGDAQAFAREMDAEQYVKNQAGDPAIVAVPVYSPVTPVPTQGGIDEVANQS